MITKALVETTPTLISAAKPRGAMVIQNLGDVAVFVAVEGSPSVSTDAGESPGLRIEPDGLMLMLEPTTHGQKLHQAIYAVHGGE